MNAASRTTVLSVALLLGATTRTASAGIFTMELPELTGTFVPGQAPISANFHIPGLFTSTGNMTLSITATGVPGSDVNAEPVPAGLLASVDNRFGTPLLSPTAFGPYGPAADTQDSVFVYDNGASLSSSGVSGEVVIDTNDIFPDVAVAPEVQITAVILTLEAELCWTQPFGDAGCVLNNPDPFVGVDDLNIVLVNWNTDGLDSPGADINRDGFVGVDDLNPVLIYWNQNLSCIWGCTLGSVAESDPIPEPASLALLGAGIVSLIRRCRR